MQFRKYTFIPAIVGFLFLCSSAFALDFTYTDSGTTITITGYTGSGGAVVIPDTIDGKPVVSIGNYAFYKNTTLTSVTIPSSVTAIGNHAFQLCRGLTSATIPSSVRSIGIYAFYYCTGLTSVAIPSGVTSIGEYTFAYCTGLTSATIPSSVRSIGIYAFYYCTGLTSVAIPSGVTRIEDYTFAYCTGLTSVAIPSGVTRIKDYAFASCTGLTSVTIPSSVTWIWEGAFSGCTGLTSVTIPSSVTSIGDYAFLGCASLTNINVDEGNMVYSSQDGVFYSKLKTELIQYPGGKSGAFSIPSSVTSIGAYAFYLCTGLTSVAIPSSVTRIKDDAFASCTGLTNVTIPASVTSIGNYAFVSCTGLTAAYFYGNAPTMGSNVFYGCASGFTVYYLAGRTGFTNPWHGYPTALFTLPSTTTTTQPAATTTTSVSSSSTSTPTVPACVDNDGDGYGENCAAGPDCDDTVFGQGLITWYYDYDNDGYGKDLGASCTTPIRACLKPEMDGINFSELNTDCKDNDPERHPGATEACGDEIDRNCDGLPNNVYTFYRDADGDLFGDPNNRKGSCDNATPPHGYVYDSSDCNDGSDLVHPGAADDNCNGKDDDCDGTVDEGSGAQITYYRDADADTYGNAAVTLSGSGCTAPAGYVTNSTDCNDSNIAVHPGATETCNEVDDDCDGSTDESVCITTTTIAPTTTSSVIPTTTTTRPTTTTTTATTGTGCAAWLGDWTFTYNDGCDNVAITSVCNNEDGSNPACLPVKDGVPQTYWVCIAEGKRASDNQTIQLRLISYDTTIYGYYEATTAEILAGGMNTPRAEIPRDSFIGAAFTANTNVFGLQSGEKGCSPDCQPETTTTSVPTTTTSVCTGAAWTTMTSGTTKYLFGVWGNSASDVFAVGNSGTILHYNGTTWLSMTSGTTQELRGVWGSSGNDVFAVGYYGTILHYNGTSWSTMSSGGTAHLMSVWGSSGNDVFAVAQGGTILHYNGTTWSSMTSGTTQHLWDVWGNSGSDVFAVGYYGTIVHYNGTTWSSMPSGTTQGLNAVWGSSGNDVFVAGIGGIIVHYNGTTWTAMSSGASQNFFGVWGSSGKNVFAADTSGAILHYNGMTWSSMTSGTTQGLESVWGSSGSDVFVVGHTGTILHYYGCGATTTTAPVTTTSAPPTTTTSVPTTTTSVCTGAAWTAMTSGTTSQLMGVWGSSGSDIFAVGAAGKILHYNGVTWSSMTSGTTQPLYGVWGSSGSDIFAVGYAGTIRHYDGTTWTAMSSGTTSQLMGVWGSSGSDVFAVGATGTILHYNGTTWSSTSSGTTYYAYMGVWGSSGSDVFAVGSDGAILHYNGMTWSSMTSGTTQYLNAVWGSSGSDVFVVGTAGAILHYNGVTWSSMTSGTAKYFFSVWGSSGSDVFAVGNSGVILHYNGVTWSSMTSGTTQPLYGVWGSSGSDVFAVGGYGMILRYNNCGATTTTAPTTTSSVIPTTTTTRPVTTTTAPVITTTSSVIVTTTTTAINCDPASAPDADGDGKIEYHSSCCSYADGTCDYNDSLYDGNKIDIINDNGSIRELQTYADVSFNAVTPGFHPARELTRNYCEDLTWGGIDTWEPLDEQDIWELASANYPFEANCSSYGDGCHIFSTSWSSQTEWVPPPGPWSAHLDLSLMYNENWYRGWILKGCNGGNFSAGCPFWFGIRESDVYSYPKYETDSRWPTAQPMVICKATVNPSVTTTTVPTTTTSAMCNDNDGDGYGQGTACLGPDCNDNDANVNPGHVEAPCNGIDDNCDGLVDEGWGEQITYYRDADDDTYGNTADTLSGSGCTAPSGYVTNSTDCDDNNSAVHPGAVEVCNGIDDDCDGHIDEFVCSTTTTAPSTTTTTAPACIDEDGDRECADTDCNDHDPAINSSAAEVCNNGKDDDCDGLFDEGCEQGCQIRLMYPKRVFIADELSLFFIIVDNDKCAKGLAFGTMFETQVKFVGPYNNEGSVVMAGSFAIKNMAIGLLQIAPTADTGVYYVYADNKKWSASGAALTVLK